MNLIFKQTFLYIIYCIFNLNKNDAMRSKSDSEDILFLYFPKGYRDNDTEIVIQHLSLSEMFGSLI